MLYEKVLILSLVLGMFFLLEDKDNISGDCIRLQNTKSQSQPKSCNIQSYDSNGKNEILNILLHQLHQGM